MGIGHEGLMRHFTPPSTPDGTVGALVHRLSEQVTELVRSELRLARAELAQKDKAALEGTHA